MSRTQEDEMDAKLNDLVSAANEAQKVAQENMQNLLDLLAEDTANPACQELQRLVYCSVVRYVRYRKEVADYRRAQVTNKK
jgi:uncharacterized protein YigA (DUF484 family)